MITAAVMKELMTLARFEAMFCYFKNFLNTYFQDHYNGYFSDFQTFLSVTFQQLFTSHSLGMVLHEDIAKRMLLKCFSKFEDVNRQ